MTILVDNFSIGIDEWTTASGLGSFIVDVVDMDYPISISGTYFLHDGVAISTVLSEISNGYRAYYSPSSVYSDGTITITIHAENENSEVVEQSYYLLYGYHIEFNDTIDWGPKSTVITDVKVSNLVFCPNTIGESVFFETKDFDSYDLGASISAVQSVDLGAIVYPQNSFFFYGRTYTITVSNIKDFGGNELGPVVFTFTIENPND